MHVNLPRSSCPLFALCATSTPKISTPSVSGHSASEGPASHAMWATSATQEIRLPPILANINKRTKSVDEASQPRLTVQTSPQRATTADSHHPHRIPSPSQYSPTYHSFRSPSTKPNNKRKLTKADVVKVITPEDSSAVWGGYVSCLVQLNRPDQGETKRCHEEVNTTLFLQTVKEKEDLHKSIQRLLNQIHLKETELNDVDEKNKQQKLDLFHLKDKRSQLEKDRIEQETKQQRIQDLQDAINSLNQQRDSMLQSKMDTEERLDDTNAKISTQYVVKRVIENKLESALEEKKNLQREKILVQEQLELERETGLKQIEILLRQRYHHQQSHDQTKTKMENLRSTIRKLEDQLEKAKGQVAGLIKQISVHEARAARELKAERKAKEAAKEQKSRYPTGIVSIGFSDVQASTYQWEMWPEAMSVAIEMHNQIIREQLRINGGYEVESTLNAVWWCLFVQEALMRAEWPKELLDNSQFSKVVYDQDGTMIFRGLRVRMGVHMGKPECRLDAVSGRVDYFGNMINRAAKIQSAATGGQVFMSGKVWEAVRREINDVYFEHLGEHTLPGLRSSEQIIQILPKSLSERIKHFPALETHIPKTEMKEKFSQNIRAEEEKQNEAVSEKLSAIVSEIESTLKAQQERQQARETTKAILQLEKQIKEAEEAMIATKADEEVLVYQIEKAKHKNQLYEQDIEQARQDSAIAFELLEGCEKERRQAACTLICANAKSFCLMIRQNLLEGQIHRALEEHTMLEKHLAEQEMLDLTTDRLVIQLRERVSQLQSQNLQAKGEADYYTKQVQELERSLRSCNEITEVFQIADANNTNKKSTLLKRISYGTDMMRKRVLTEQMQREGKERKALMDKMATVKNNIQSTDDTARKGLLKKIKLLDQEIVQIRSERDFLMKQIGTTRERSAEVIQKHTKNLEDTNKELIRLTQQIAGFEQKLATLTHRDKAMPLEEHLTALRRQVASQMLIRYGKAFQGIDETEEAQNDNVPLITVQNTEGTTSSEEEMSSEEDGESLYRFLPRDKQREIN
ncbi:hypothetical protein PROFUN_07499 [Planoprotostelium fungivorum]|uniref:Guanylate cyclase domain-containing protein n=1 Tax=Planoprotostelium fungivorum TaxID=1890364 RepID=A0A2P6NLJ3_9EUKA|nr:hypothetical protein PROFUN_07499 [Planoprotostelium fungivorum]